MVGVYNVGKKYGSSNNNGDGVDGNVDDARCSYN